MAEDKTRILDTEPPASWTNPRIAEENRRLTQQEAALAYPQPAPKIRLRGPRTLAVLLLTPLFICLVLSAALAGWAQKTLVSTSGFSLVTNDLLNDQELQNSLQEAVVQDIMATPAVQDLLGDGSATGLWGSVQNWAHGTLEGTITSTVDGVFSAADYPETWQQVMEASHTYNMGNPATAGIDIAPIFNAVDAKIGNILGFDPDLTKSSYILPLQSAASEQVIHNLNLLKAYGATWQPQLTACIVLGLLIFLLAPGKRFWWATFISGLTSITLWALSVLLGRVTLPTLGSETAQVFATGLTDAFTSSLRQHLFTVASTLMIAASIFLFLALVITVVKLSAKGTTGVTQRLLKALG